MPAVKYVFLTIITALLLTPGCGPGDANSDAPSKKESVGKTTIRRIPETRMNYRLLTDPWDRFFSESPTVYVLTSLTEGVTRILEKQQKLAESILTQQDGIGAHPGYRKLSAELEHLKTAVPTVETRSARRRARHRGSEAYVDADGDAHIRPRDGYYHTRFREVHKSSSPALARSVENLVINATVDDLEQRIAALLQLCDVWSRKARVMSPNGVEGAMRRANLAYIEGLRDYAGEFMELKERKDAIKAEIAKAKQQRNQKLQAWRQFEENRLPVLDAYVRKTHRFAAEPGPDGEYVLPPTGEPLRFLAACEIGDRTLYFDLSGPGDHPHPFELVRVGGGP